MIKFKEDTVINPLKIAFIVVIGMHIILTFFNPINILQLLAIIIAIFIFSFALVTIILNLSPILISLSRRVSSILSSVVLFMLSSVSITYNIPRLIFNTEVVNNLLVFTLLTIGCIYIGLALVNTAFPKLYRQINILIGVLSIILSLITMAVPTLGFLFLIIVICALIIMDKFKLLEIF